MKAPAMAAALDTWPVGVPGLSGIVTSRPTFATPPDVFTECVASPVPLSDTQKGEPLENETPQGLTRFGSVIAAWFTD